MKKQYFLFLVALLFATQINAQNVGIGTSTPSSKLTLVGAADGDNGIFRLQHMTASDFTGNVNITGHAADGTRKWYLGHTSGTHDAVGIINDMVDDFLIRTGRDISFVAGGSETDMFIQDNGNIGIGTITPNFARLQIAADGTADTETFVHFSVDDASEDKFSVGNVTGTAGVFSPGVFGSHGSTTRPALSFWGLTGEAMDIAANENAPVMTLNARKDANFADVTSTGVIAERDILHIKNHNTVDVSVEADGDLELENDNEIKMPNNAVVGFAASLMMTSISGSGWPGTATGGVEITGLEVEEGQKIFVSGALNIESAGSGSREYAIKILRTGGCGTASVYGNGGSGMIIITTGGEQLTVPISFLDTPNCDGTVSYRVEIKLNSGADITLKAAYLNAMKF